MGWGWIGDWVWLGLFTLSWAVLRFWASVALLPQQFFHISLWKLSRLSRITRRKEDNIYIWNISFASPLVTSYVIQRRAFAAHDGFLSNLREYRWRAFTTLKKNRQNNLAQHSITVSSLISWSGRVGSHSIHLYIPNQSKSSQPLTGRLGFWVC